MWQSDMVEGPILPDPEKRGSHRKAYLDTFLDDHSRMCLHGRFSFRGALPALEGAVVGIDTITTEFMTQQLHNHPLYDPAAGA